MWFVLVAMKLTKFLLAYLDFLTKVFFLTQKSFFFHRCFCFIGCFCFVLFMSPATMAFFF